MVQKLKALHLASSRPSLESRLLLGEPKVYEEKFLDFPYPNLHLRLPVTGQGTPAYDVKAEIVGGSAILIPEKERLLFWTRSPAEYDPASMKKTPEVMAENLRVFRYSRTHSLTIHPNEIRYADLLVKIPGYGKYQIANIDGEERQLKGNYELEVRVSGQNIEPQNKLIKFHACTNDMKVLSSL